MDGATRRKREWVGFIGCRGFLGVESEFAHLNPLEMVWALIRGRIAGSIFGLTMLFALEWAVGRLGTTSMGGCSIRLRASLVEDAKLVEEVEEAPLSGYFASRFAALRREHGREH
jgi:hypothetical protein